MKKVKYFFDKGIITPRELAKRVGVTRQMAYYWKDGALPTEKHAKLIEQVVGEPVQSTLYLPIKNKKMNEKGVKRVADLAKKYNVKYTTAWYWCKHDRLPSKQLMKQIIKDFDLDANDLKEIFWG